MMQSFYHFQTVDSLVHLNDGPFEQQDFKAYLIYVIYRPDDGVCNHELSSALVTWIWVHVYVHYQDDTLSDFRG